MVEPGDIVMYHHNQDGEDWPAMVLKVDMVEPIDGPPYEHVYLQVFRGRGNEWPRAIEGTTPGTFSVRESNG